MANCRLTIVRFGRVHCRRRRRPSRVYWLFRKESRDSKRCNNILLSWPRLPSRPAPPNQQKIFSSFFYKGKRKKKSFLICFAYFFFLFSFLFLISFAGLRVSWCVSDPSSIFRSDGDNDRVSDSLLPPLFPTSPPKKKKKIRKGAHSERGLLVLLSVCLQQNVAEISRRRPGKKETKTNDIYVYYTRHLVCAIQTQKQLVKAQGTNPSFLTGKKTNERP